MLLPTVTAPIRLHSGDHPDQGQDHAQMSGVYSTTSPQELVCRLWDDIGNKIRPVHHFFFREAAVIINKDRAGTAREGIGNVPL